MNEKLFPKPQPANPLPLDVWLERTDRAESGREAFFCGREAEYHVFQRSVNSLNDGIIGGGTMIFQGAPGAGKTVLMQECMEAVRQHSTPEKPWVAVDIKPEILKSPFEVVMLLINAVNQESERLSKLSLNKNITKQRALLDIGRALGNELSERGFGVGGYAIGPKSKSDDENTAGAQWVFHNSAHLFRDFHLVVFIDEAQNTPVDDSTKGVLSCLHDPPDKIPLLATFFRLSDNESRLTECGISGPADQRVINLELLDYGESCDVIRSIFKTYNFTGSRQDQKIWIERLAELSQGWPQHINRAAVAACRVIVEHGGEIKSEYLEQALHNAQDRRETYYRMILRRCSG